MNHQHLREELCHTARQMLLRGLNKGTAGNLGCRVSQDPSDGFLITPSAMPVHEMHPEHIVHMDFHGYPLSAGKPSSEWRFHRDIFIARTDIKAIAHCHSPFATTLACQRRDIPAFHYMVALTGSHSIPCAPYRLFGTAELSDVAVNALKNSNACLLANHGQIAVGDTISGALELASEVESLAEIYWRSLQGGTPSILSEAEMNDVFLHFKDYRKPNS